MRLGTLILDAETLPLIAAVCELLAEHGTPLQRCRSSVYFAAGSLRYFVSHKGCASSELVAWCLIIMGYRFRERSGIMRVNLSRSFGKRLLKCR